MRNILATVFAFFLVFVVASSAAHAQTRYATCDVCGYCPTIEFNNAADPPTSTCTPITPPGNWEACVKCMYGIADHAAAQAALASCKTLEVDATTGLQFQPIQGHQYTMLGCISSSSSFSDASGSGAANFIQTLFDFLVFKITGGVAFLYLIYGAFLYLTSQGDTERLNHAKRVILGAIIGLIFTVSSVFVVNLIGNGILKIPGFSGTTP